MEALSNLLATGVSVVEAMPGDPSGKTLLHAGATHGSSQALTALLGQSGAKTSVRDADGRTPLLHAAAGGRHDNVSVLLSVGGAYLNSRAADGRSALHLAAEAGHAETVALLCQRNVDVNARVADTMEVRSRESVTLLNMSWPV